MSYIRPIGDLSGTEDQRKRELDRYFVDVNCVTENIDNTYIDACNKLYGRSVPNPVTNDVTNEDDNRQIEGPEHN